MKIVTITAVGYDGSSEAFTNSVADGETVEFVKDELMDDLNNCFSSMPPMMIFINIHTLNLPEPTVHETSSEATAGVPEIKSE